MKSFRGKAAVNAGNSRLVSAKWANYNQRAVPITAVSRKRKESEKLDLCRPVVPEVIRTYVLAATLVVHSNSSFLLHFLMRN
jgi:hypothetical protein